MPGTSAETTPALAASTKPAPVDPLDPLSASYLPPSSRLAQSTSSAGDAKSTDDALQQLVNDDRHFSLVRNFRLADLVTIGNGVCGALSIFSCGNFLIHHDRNDLWAALFFPLLGMFFDFMDGRVARWRKETSMLGQELDSLADSISFGVAPATIAFTIGLRSRVDTLVLAAFVCCGVARLARFNATIAAVPKDPSGKSKYFEGLPIPSSLGLVAVMMECVRRNQFEGVPGCLGLPGGLIRPLVDNFGVDVHWLSVLFGCWATAMVSKTLRIPKP